MSTLRTVHGLIAVLGGIAFGLILFGSTGRAGTAVLAVAFVPLTWSLEMLRVAILSRPEKRP